MHDFNHFDQYDVTEIALGLPYEICSTKLETINNYISEVI